MWNMPWAPPPSPTLYNHQAYAYINIYMWSFFLGGISSEVFFVSASVCDMGTGISRSDRFVWAPSSGGGSNAPCQPYPFRTRPGSGTLAERDKREVRNFFNFGRYTPELFLDLGISRAWTKKTCGKHVFPSWHHFQIGFILRFHTLFSWSHLEAFGLLCKSYDWLLCRCFWISDVKVNYLCSSAFFFFFILRWMGKKKLKLNTLPRIFERSLSARRAVPYPTTSLHQCPCWFVILEIYNLLYGRRLWYRVNQTIARNQRTKQVKC